MPTMVLMRIIGQKSIETIKDRLRDNRAALRDLDKWVGRVKAATWRNHNDLRQAPTHNPDPVGVNRVIFDIQRNNFRLIVRVNYKLKNIRPYWFGTHKDYDRINAATVGSNL